ncbi:Hypothetical predicted protein [Pelobates cultripes]|uniref:Uncharacterized protein n=1 Tax=Pelobates cultripes TaxID=61616 RepID=A0AAD1SJ78_PELCU|nr:Hypothetical predicted protein [Pelobates cultripes]
MDSEIGSFGAPVVRDFGAYGLLGEEAGLYSTAWMAHYWRQMKWNNKFPRWQAGRPSACTMSTTWRPNGPRRAQVYTPLAGLDLVPTKAFLTHEPLEDVPRTTTPLLSAVHQPGILLQAKIGIRTEGTSGRLMQRRGWQSGAYRTRPHIRTLLTLPSG